jgi:hypothetical protein
MGVEQLSLARLRRIRWFGKQVGLMYVSKQLFWLRLSHKGIIIKNLQQLPLNSNELAHSCKGIRLGKWFINLLN